MKRFTQRVEHDLNQIADRATPSSTAWEAVRQRIGEQDNNATSGDTTMEVIMLSPDRNEPRNRSRTWMLVAASFAAVALVGGLIVAANRDTDDNVPADQPTVTVSVPDTTGVDGETAPAPDAATPVDPDVQQPDPVPAVEPEAPDASIQLDTLPAVEPVLATSGTLNARCSFGAQANAPGRINTDQTCRFDESENPPFDATQEITLTQLTRVQLESVGAGAFVSISDSGYLTAGVSYESGSIARFVGAVPGTGEYEGESILLSGRGFDNVTAIYDWSTGVDDAPLPTTEEGGISAEIAITCSAEFIEGDDTSQVLEQTCTYAGAEARFVPEPEVFTGDLFAADPDATTLAPGTPAFITGTSDSGSIMAGIATGADSIVRAVGVRPGTGEFDGMLVHDVMHLIVDDAFNITGTIRSTVYPDE